MFQLPYKLEHLFSYNATLQSPREVIGPIAEGLRVNAFVTGGKVDGPRLRGIVRPGSGADWLTIRTDGVAMLDVRGTIETHDAGLIYTAYRARSDCGQDAYARPLKGAPVLDCTPIRTAPTFQTAHPDYVWLNRIQALGIGEIIRSRSEVRYDVYAVW